MTKNTAFTPLSVDLGFITDPSRPVLSLAIDVSDMQCADIHRHPRAQLIYSAKGLMKVHVNKVMWLVSPEQAIWVPPFTDHKVYFIGENHVRNLYFDPSVTDTLPTESFTFDVSHFLRELVIRIVNFTEQSPVNSPQERLIQVLLDEIGEIKPARYFLPVTTHPKLKKVTDILMDNPGDKRDITSFAEIACVSPRTLLRLFIKELGMPFNMWRKQLRMITAIEKLSEGCGVSQVSDYMGYNSPSAFIDMFKKETGTSPAKFMKM